MTKRQRLSSAASLVILASLGLLSMMSSPRWERLRAVDVVQLLGCGACFGVAFMLVLGKPFKE